MMEILKRNGKSVNYDKFKIIMAIENAMIDSNSFNQELSRSIEYQICNEIFNSDKKWSVEDISDRVEMLLMENHSFNTAKAYILYRNNRAKEREKSEPVYKMLSKEFLSKYKHLQNPMGQLGSFVYYRTYSRWIPELQRREEWRETCARTIDYNCGLVETSKEEAQQLFDNMFNLRQFLSGRSIWVGNTKVSEQFPMANYNCSFEIIKDIEAFGDLFYLLMLGSGVGVRLLKEDVKQLPCFRNTYEVIHQNFEAVDKADRAENTSLIFDKNIAKIIIGDSKNGWVDGLKYYLSLLTDIQFKNIDTIVFNYDNVRPSGEKLKTFGGTASGHGALKDMYAKIDKTIKNKSNAKSDKIKLKPIDCLDICNIIGEGVVVGGEL